MSNTPLPDIRIKWSDGTILKYSLLTGQTSINCPHIESADLFDVDRVISKRIENGKHGENGKNGENSEKNGENYGENGVNGASDGEIGKRGSDTDSDDNVEGPNGTDNKTDTKNIRKIGQSKNCGYYWEGDLVGGLSPNPGSPHFPSNSPYSPSSTAYSKSISLEILELNPLPVILKVYLEIAQKAIKRCLQEENDMGKQNSKYTKKYNKISYNDKINSDNDRNKKNQLNGNVIVDNINENKIKLDANLSKLDGNLSKIDTPCPTVYIDHL